MASEGVEKKLLWENEPDSLSFVDEDTGYTCFIRRNLIVGHLCGYVFIPDDLVNKAKELSEKIKDIDIHGGITYKGYIEGIADKIKPYAIGFDCAHAWDFVPYMYMHGCKELSPEVIIEGTMEYQSKMDITYKDINFVKNECRKLAKQLHEILTGEKEKCQEK